MANIRWTGQAAAVAQVDTFTPGGTIEADDRFILTVTGLDGTSTTINVAAGGTTASAVVTALIAAWNASTHPLCTPVTASGTATLILTADVAGVPFFVAPSTTEANGSAADAQTFTRAATTASAGPKHWDSPANWDGGAVPGAASGQDVYLDNASGDILYGLDQSGIANALNSLNIGKSFTGRIGVSGAAGFAGTYLKIKSAAVNIGQHAGFGTPAGSGRVMIDTGSTAATITIESTGTSVDANKPAVRLLADSASTVVNILAGKVGVASDAGQTSVVGSVFAASAVTELYLGSGLTVTTIASAALAAIVHCAATTLTIDGGTLTTYGSGAPGTVTINKGRANLKSAGTITTLNAIAGLADLTGSLVARTVTTAKVGLGGSIKYDPAVVTMTNKVQPYPSSGNLTLTASAA